MFRYILRYYIDPGFCPEQRIEELLLFVKKAKIDEVMLFFNAEELNIGHITLDELSPWLEMAKTLKKLLAESGVDLSVNPWTTLVHSPRGRRLKENQKFTLMVGANGENNQITTCPLCSNWQKYLTELWCNVARELNVSTIWIEDDWRYHNHGRALGFGGCYCDLHMKAFSAKVGHEVSRDELLRKIFAPGEPHPWRKIWMDINGDSMADFIADLKAEIKKVSPVTRLALMCGSPDIVSIEGRKWNKLEKAVGMENGGFMVRPSISPYTEVWSMRQYPVPARMTLAYLERPLQIFPELESAPRHGAYSKGNSYSSWEIMQCAAFGANGITINYYDMLGNGLGQRKNFARTLSLLKPQLNTIADLKLDDNQSCGAEILISPKVSEYYRADNYSTGESLNNYSGEWGNVAAILGFSCVFCCKKTNMKQPLLVNNQTLNAFSDSEIREMLKGSMILDAPAAATLIKRGFGTDIGVSDYKIHRHNVSGYSYEEISESAPDVYGISHPRMTIQRACRILYEFSPAKSVELCSKIYHYNQTAMFGGSFFYKNSMGGKIVTLATPLGDGGDTEWFYMGYFNDFRRIFIQRLLQKCAPDMQGVFVEDSPMQASWIKTANGHFMAFLNPATDPVEELSLYLKNLEYKHFHILTENGEWEDAAPIIIKLPNGDFRLKLYRHIPVHGKIILYIS